MGNFFPPSFPLRYRRGRGGGLFVLLGRWRIFRALNANLQLPLPFSRFSSLPWSLSLFGIRRKNAAASPISSKGESADARKKGEQNWKECREKLFFWGENFNLSAPFLSESPRKQAAPVGLDGDWGGGETLTGLFFARVVCAVLFAASVGLRRPPPPPR